MLNDSVSTIPKIVMDTSVVPAAEQFAFWAKHSQGARLEQVVPGPFIARGDLWNLGALQITLIEVDPFVAVRDKLLVNSVDADYLQLVQLLEGTITFEAEGKTTSLEAPVSFMRDYSRPSAATSTRIRCLIYYFARDFLEEIIGPVRFQGPLPPVPELALIHDVAISMIRFFPHAAADSAPLYATILRDLAAAAILRAGIGERTDQLSLFALAQRYVAEQPPGTLSVPAMTAALGISRSVLYRLFEREGGPLAYDRRRRLRAVHRAISNPLNRSTLSELAIRYGFHDQANLSRSFRKAFGFNPSAIGHYQAGSGSSDADVAPNNIRLSLEEIY